MKKLIAATIVAVFLISFTSQAQSCCLPKNDKKVVNTNNENQQETKTVTLKVTGMTCEACSNHVAAALKKVDGVMDQAIEYKEDKAIVTFNPKVTTIETIIEAINKTPYKASLMKTKS